MRPTARGGILEVMKLYLLRRRGAWIYSGEAQAMIVHAENREEARDLARKQGIKRDGYTSAEAWTDAEKSTCEGVPLDGEARVLLVEGGQSLVSDRSGGVYVLSRRERAALQQSFDRFALTAASGGTYECFAPKWWQVWRWVWWLWATRVRKTPFGSVTFDTTPKLGADGVRRSVRVRVRTIRVIGVP